MTRTAILFLLLAAGFLFCGGLLFAWFVPGIQGMSRAEYFLFLLLVGGFVFCGGLLFCWFVGWWR